MRENLELSEKERFLKEICESAKQIGEKRVFLREEESLIGEKGRFG